MMETASSKRPADVLITIRKVLAQETESVKALESTFRSCASNLRMGTTSHTLRDLTEAIENLALLTELVGQLRIGLLAAKVEGSPFSSWQGSDSTEAFQEMVAALEGKDWVFLADLLEYEICPLMTETEKEMLQLSERL